MQARNEKLQAMQEVIREIFESSIETLCNLSEDEFKVFVTESILNSDIVGEQNIILNDSSKKIINKTFLAVE